EEWFWADLVFPFGIDPTEWDTWMRITAPIRDCGIEYIADRATVRLETKRAIGAASSAREEIWCTELWARGVTLEDFGFELHRPSAAARTYYPNSSLDIDEAPLQRLYKLATNDATRVREMLSGKLVEAMESAAPTRLGV